MAIIKELSPFVRGSSVDYLLGLNRRSGIPDYRKPSVLIGDPDRFQRVAATIPFKKPFTALILSFQEALADRKVTEHADSLVDALCAGLPRTQFEVLAVGHSEKAAKSAPRGAPTWRSGVHLNIGNLHLPTGKCLEPFYYAQDQLYAALWLEILNIENGYSSGRACGTRAAVRLLDDPAEAFFPGGKLPPPEARPVGGEWHQRLQRGFAERRAARAAHHARLFGSPRRGCIHPTTVARNFENTVSLSISPSTSRRTHPMDPQPHPANPPPSLSSEPARQMNALLAQLLPSVERLLVCEANLKLIYAAVSDCERELAISRANSSNSFSELSTSVQTLVNGQTNYIAAHQELVASVANCISFLATLGERLEASEQQKRTLSDECQRYRKQAEQSQEQWQQVRRECDVMMREFCAIRREVLSLKSQSAAREVHAGRW